MTKVLYKLDSTLPVRRALLNSPSSGLGAQGECKVRIVMYNTLAGSGLTDHGQYDSQVSEVMLLYTLKVVPIEEIANAVVLFTALKEVRW